MRKVVRAYRSLTDEQRRLMAEKAFTIEKPVGDAIALLKGIADVDKLLVSEKSNSGCLVGFGVIGLLLGVMAYLIAPPAGITLLVLSVIVLVPGIRMSRFVKRTDVADHLRNFTVPVLQVLRDDIDPDIPIKVTTDLRPGVDPSKLAEKGEPYSYGRGKATDSLYVDPWLSAEATLIDGSKLRWSITDRVRHRYKSYRSARGKYKSKTKITRKSDVQVQLIVRGKSYEVSGDQKKKTLEARRQEKYLEIDGLHPRVLLEAVAELFAGLTPAGGGK